MTGFVDKVKDALSSGPKSTANTDHHTSGDKQAFTIQPHPATSNDPSDLQPKGPGSGLNSTPEYSAHTARGPHVPSNDVANTLEQPLSRAELDQRQAELNK